jgi:hypothetical protein
MNANRVRVFDNVTLSSTAVDSVPINVAGYSNFTLNGRVLTGEGKVTLTALAPDVDNNLNFHEIGFVATDGKINPTATTAQIGPHDGGVDSLGRFTVNIQQDLGVIFANCGLVKIRAVSDGANTFTLDLHMSTI